MSFMCYACQMTQWKENMDHEEILAERYRQQGKTGIHFCPEWSFMVIHDESPEKKLCNCVLEKNK